MPRPPSRAAAPILDVGGEGGVFPFHGALPAAWFRLSPAFQTKQQTERSLRDAARAATASVYRFLRALAT